MSADSADTHSWNAAFKTADDGKLLKTHVEEYAKMAQTCVDKVSRLWNEIGLPRSDRQKEFDEVATAVRNVWSATVDRAERKKRERQKEIEEAVSEIYRIKEELGDCTRDNRRQGIEGLLKLEMIVDSSLHTRYEAIQELLREWRSQRSQREAEFKELQSEINNLRLRFGEVVIASSLSPCKYDVSLMNLQKLSEELEQCKAEKLRRERELAALLSKLRSACVPLGENDIEIAASAHPSLRYYREALPGHFSLVRPSFSNQPGLQRNIRPEDVELDLSDQTFASLGQKILEVYDLGAAREKQTAEVAAALKYLWDMLEIPEDDLDRGMTMRALEGPTKLHMQSIEKCRNEIRQLETTRSSQLWELIHKAREELEDVCEETMIPMPQLCPLLTFNDYEDEDNKPVGRISEALAKLRKTINEMRELSEKRAPIIQQITQLENARVEVEWLTEYELDADRYKGRDSSKKIDRALKAGRMRDKFPDMIKRLKKSVCKWEQDERRSFIYRGQDYGVVLEDMLMSLDKKQPTTGKQLYRSRTTRRPVSRNTLYTPPPTVNSPHGDLEGDLFASGGPPLGIFNSDNQPGVSGRTKKVIKRSVTPRI
eukprot:g5938.t1